MVLGAVQTNCYFLYYEGESEVLCIDPADQGEEIHRKLAEQGFHVQAILLTHGHFDHIWGVEQLVKESGAKVYALEEERDICESADLNLSAQMRRPFDVKPDIDCKDGEVLTIGKFNCKVIGTPGHTKGSCCFYFEEDGILVSGDTLFQESVGRSDFPTGNMATLVRSIKSKLFVLPEEVVVYPGHGDHTTIGHEKVHNAFC